MELAERKARAAGTVTACRFNPSAGFGTVTLVPDLDEIALNGAQSFTWSVYGVPGVPVAQLSGSSEMADVAVSGNGGVAQVKVTLKQTLAQGQWLMVTISDANHLASRDVRIVGTTAMSAADGVAATTNTLLPNRKIAVPPLAQSAGTRSAANAAVKPAKPSARPQSAKASAVTTSPAAIKASAAVALIPAPMPTPMPMPTPAAATATPVPTRIPTISKTELDQICRANQLGSNEACYDQIESLKDRCAQTLGIANSADTQGALQSAIRPGGRCYPQGAR